MSGPYIFAANGTRSLMKGDDTVTIIGVILIAAGVILIITDRK